MKLRLKDLKNEGESLLVTTRGLGDVLVTRLGGGVWMFEASWDVSTPHGFEIKRVFAMSFSEISDAVTAYNRRAMADNRSAMAATV
jgi:hypothetical protein